MEEALGNVAVYVVSAGLHAAAGPWHHISVYFLMKKQFLHNLQLAFLIVNFCLLLPWVFFLFEPQLNGSGISRAQVKICFLSIELKRLKSICFPLV